MIYSLLVHFTIVLHFLWILFIIFGFIFALKRSKIAYLHLSGVFLALFLNLMGWYCPLTYLENYLYTLHDIKSAYTKSFIIHYLEYLIYPDLPEPYIRIFTLFFVTLYVIFYTYLAKRYKLLGRIKRHLIQKKR